MIHETSLGERLGDGKEGIGSREGGGETVDKDRLQHLTGCPGELLKVIEREKDTYGGRETQDRKRREMWQGGWLKEVARQLWGGRIGTYAVYSEISHLAKTLQMDAHM